MTELHTLSATRLIEEMDAGNLGAEELLESYLARIEQLNPTIGAYLTIDEAGARQAAQMADRRRASGEPAGALGGVPVAIKDNICSEGLRTTCSSRMLENFVPPYDAHVIHRLRLAGAVMLGKVNLDEFAMGSSCEHAHLGTTCNPWDTSRVPGGSSGGSAAALAAGLAPLALGSDTGGSIRLPAAFSGVVGLKPTYGRVSRYGLMAFGSSLDQIGPMARNVTDCALMLEVISGYDRRDATSLPQEVPTYSAQLEQSVEGLKIGVPEQYWADGLDPEVRAAGKAALECLRSMGAETVRVSLPHTKYAISCYYLVATSEASSNLARYDGVHYGHCTAEPKDLYEVYARSRAEGFGPEVKRRILLGTFALSSGYYDAYYGKALKVRNLIRQDYDAAFEEVDVIVSPTAPFPAFRRGEKMEDPLQMYLCDVLTVGANLAGLPGMSLPCGFTEAGLPIGLQILGKPLDEMRVLQVGRAFETANEFHDMVAPL